VSGSAPPGLSLLPQQFFWDGTTSPGKIWVGVPTSVDPSGKRMLLDLGAVAPGAGLAPYSLDFMSGSLPAGLTFTRASPGTYTDVAGVLRTAPANTPRFDYDPVTHAPRGLLIEEARTNVCLQSACGAAPWTPASIGTDPVLTANATIAPDGTMTGSRLAMPAVSGGNASLVYQGVPTSVAPYVFSIWMKGSVGGEPMYFSIALGGGGVFYSSPRLALTTQWRRFVVTVPNLPAGGYAVQFGTDLRDPTQAATPAQNVYVWGAQLEQATFPTSNIVTTTAAVTRAGEQCVNPFSNRAWFTPPGGSWFAEFVPFAVLAGTNPRVIWSSALGSPTPLFFDPGFHLGQYDATSAFLTANAGAANVVQKAVTTWAPGVGRNCLNGGAVVTSAGLTAGYAVLASTVDLYFLQSYNASESMNGYIRRFNYWPRVLTDAEMQAVTAP
jgi:hypothetical protein